MCSATDAVCIETRVGGILSESQSEHGRRRVQKGVHKESSVRPRRLLSSRCLETINGGTRVDQMPVPGDRAGMTWAACNKAGSYRKFLATAPDQIPGRRSRFG
mmetsp:Transcript_1104/g.2215  ORF Transcript_1104/g.2215 Transcript_1104/m.2215 type:complete len:103 (-) Transcript_1104:450-758(-)